MAHVFPVVVDINVGGERMTTLLSTLTKDKDSMLAAMFSGRHTINKDKDGCYFIDCDGTLFKHILNYLRFGNLPPAEEALKVYDLATYFRIQSLVTVLEQYQSVQHRTQVKEMKSTFDMEKYETLKQDIINEFYKSYINPNDNIILHITSNSEYPCHCQYIVRLLQSDRWYDLSNERRIVMRYNDTYVSRELQRCLAYDLSELGFVKYTCTYLPEFYQDKSCCAIFLLNNSFEKIC